MAGLDANTKLLLHLNGANGATSTKDASLSNHAITFHGTAQLDTAVKKFGLSSLLLDGDSDYLSLLDSDDWDIVGSNSDSWTIGLWVKHTDHVLAEGYVVQAEEPANHWAFFHEHGQGIRFFYGAEGDTKLDIKGGEITDSILHYVTMCKVANKYGIYKDGTQVAYGTTDFEDTFSAILAIGLDTVWTRWYDGHMDEIRIQHSNSFGAAPNAELTDTITVPTKEYSRLPSVMFLE